MDGQQEKLLRSRNADLEKELTQKIRDLEIEAALERVRARTMAMRRSDELAEVVFILFQQFKDMGENPDQATIGIVNEDEWVIEYWVTMYGNQINKVFKFSIDEPNVTHRIYEAWKLQQRSLVINLTGKKLYDFTTYRASMGGATFNPDEKRRVINVAFFSKGIINVQSSESRSEESIRLLERFAGVFEGTYTRFLDLKKAEAQARESQIQLALERVRARTMSMYKSDELTEVAELLFRQVNDLGIKTWTTGFNVWSEDNNSFVDYITNPQGGFVQPYTVDTFQTLLAKQVSDARKRGDEFFVQHAEGEILKETYLALSKLGNKGQYEKMLEGGFQFPTSQVDHFVFGSKVSLMFITYEPVPEAHDIFKRFGKVFEQTYTRFLDLQKAEAQAHEAQIEAALEKVRSRSLAMHKTSELQEVVNLVFEKLQSMGIETDSVNISIPNEQTREQKMWIALNGIPYPNSIILPYHDDPISVDGWAAWDSGLDFFCKAYTFDEKNEFFNWAFEHSDLKYMPSERKKRVLQCEVYAYSLAIGKISVIQALNYSGKLLDGKENEVLKRFAKVFEQAYIRFLDLEKAEMQAREAQIEAALERVRAKTMAMHTSEHVGETVAMMFDELVKLGIENTARCGIAIIGDNQEMKLWRASYNAKGEVDLLIGHVDMTIHPLLNDVYQAWKNKQTSYSCELTGEDQKAYFRGLNNSVGYAAAQFDLEALPAKQINNVFFFPEGCVYAFTIEHLSEDAVKLFKRFASVFGQTYRRYLDLQRAETQAHEAKIEASLERVRGKAMAMHNSTDLTATANLVFIELGQLGINPIRCGVGLLSKDSRKALLYSATTSNDSDSLALIGWVELFRHPVLTKIYDSWLAQKNYFPVLNGKQLKSYYEMLLSGLAVPSFPDWQGGEKQYGHFLQFSEGCLYAWAEKPYTDSEIKILDRFKEIISLTFRRYIELQKSETSARNAVRQASLDRVRAEIASMRSTDDLDRITPLVWNELTILGIPFIRCGVFIIDEQARLIHTHLSTTDGKALATFNLPFDSQGIGQNVLPAWREKKIATIHWSKEEFAAYTKNLVEQGTVKSKERYVTEHPHTCLDLHFLPFLQGMLYVGNIAPLTDDEMNLVQSLAEAFSTAYSRYEDFNKLEAAKKQVENTLADLKAAQTKLIQSEKMASLGELTAGIAHEIQNPLNFVNNFSEVNQEMIEELQEELKSGNIDEALAIAADIKQNEQKINHHGKRADGIVKGMLQHSRTTSGEKQLTDINALADEFLRLSYHGLRAKDKTFTSEMATLFDPDLPKIKVLPQDIGRVLLNLFNNAFYAVNQKHKALGAGYMPEVSVSTSTENGSLIITVKDNGNGIPDAIKDKIMQPFFTTKPTGEGTGLGLSLSYDMLVKGHGGSIQVKSKEGEGSEFIIQLPTSQS